MTTIQKNITVNENISMVFFKLYEENTSIFESEVKIIEWTKHNWKTKHNCLQRKEEVYIYIEDLPDEVVGYTTEANKHLRLGIKNKIIINTKQYQKIKTKLRILNVNPFLRTILNDLQVIKIKNVIELKAIDENTTNIHISIYIRLAIPKTKAIEEFIAHMISNIMDNVITIFQKDSDKIL